MIRPSSVSLSVIDVVDSCLLLEYHAPAMEVTCAPHYTFEIWPITLLDLRPLNWWLSIASSSRYLLLQWPLTCEFLAQVKLIWQEHTVLRQLANCAPSIIPSQLQKKGTETYVYIFSFTTILMSILIIIIAHSKSLHVCYHGSLNPPLSTLQVPFEHIPSDQQGVETSPCQHQRVLLS